MAITTEACTRCRRLFKYIGFGAVMCEDCKKLDQQDFDKVKAYLAENGAANLMDIAAATGVNPKFIRRYLMDSRLEIPDNSTVFLKCESCGCNIKSGKYCTACAARVFGDIKSAFVQSGDRPKDSGKMRYLDGKKTGR